MKKVSGLGRLQKKCDALLQEYVRTTNPRCESCGAPTQVAHHWIEKSRSSFLRYELENLVPLCNSCHLKIHNIFGNNVVGGFNVAEIIIKKRGKGWKNRLERLQPTYMKVDKQHYANTEARFVELLALDSAR